MEESIENISVVQSLGGSDKETERFSKASEESYRRHRHTALLDAFISLVNYTCVFGSIAIAFVLITNKVIGDELTVGDYSALIGMFYMLSAQQLVWDYIGLNFKKISPLLEEFFSS